MSQQIHQSPAEAPQAGMRRGKGGVGRRLLYRLRMRGEYIKMWAVDESYLRLSYGVLEQAPWWRIVDTGNGYLAKAPNMFWIESL